MFFKSVGTLVLGTGGGQIILVAATPLLTRIYSPENFGILTLYVAALSVFAIAATGRYELAVMLPKRNEDAKSLVHLSLAITGAITIVLGSALWIAKMSGGLVFDNWLFYLIPGVFLTGVFQVLSVWSNRNQAYKKLATASVTQTASACAAQVILGLFGSPHYGLLVGALIGAASGVSVFVGSKARKLCRLIKAISLPLMLENARTYREFPTYSLFGAFVNNLALQSPVFFIGAIFEADDTGQYGLASRVVFLPIVLLSTAVFQVMFRQISEMAQTPEKKLREYLFGKLALLVFLAGPFFLIFSFWSQEIFSLLFGPQWVDAGRYAYFLAWVAFIKFTVTPLTSVFLIKGAVKFGTYWQFAYFFTLTATMIMLCSLPLSMELFLLAFILHELVLNLICLALVWFVSSDRVRYVDKG